MTSGTVFNAARTEGNLDATSHEEKGALMETEEPEEPGWFQNCAFGNR